MLSPSQCPPLSPVRVALGDTPGWEKRADTFICPRCAVEGTTWQRIARNALGGNTHVCTSCEQRWVQYTPDELRIFETREMRDLLESAAASPVYDRTEPTALPPNNPDAPQSCTDNPVRRRTRKQLRADAAAAHPTLFAVESNGATNATD